MNILSACISPRGTAKPRAKRRKLLTRPIDLLVATKRESKDNRRREKRIVAAKRREKGIVAAKRESSPRKRIVARITEVYGEKSF